MDETKNQPDIQGKRVWMAFRGPSASEALLRASKYLKSDEGVEAQWDGVLSYDERGNEYWFELYGKV